MEESEKMEMEKKKTRLTDSTNRLHQNYLKRKENGKQKEYEERYKARREEKIKVLKRVGIPVKDLDNNL